MLVTAGWQETETSPAIRLAGDLAYFLLRQTGRPPHTQLTDQTLLSCLPHGGITNFSTCAGD